MTNFPVHTIESAPERSKPALKQLQSAFGMIPNIAGAMATSPVLINSLVGVFGNVHGGNFTEAQIQTVLLTDAVTNASTWAVAFHTALALKEGIDPADVQAIQLNMVYGPEPPFHSGTPETAPLAILQQERQSLRAITARREETARRVAAKLGITVPVTIGD